MLRDEVVKDIGRNVSNGGEPELGKRRTLAKALRFSLALLTDYPFKLAHVHLATSADFADGSLHTL